MDEEVDGLARQFMATMPRVMHRLGSELRGQSGDGQLSMAQFRVLAMLSTAPHRLNELAAAHEVTAPTMSRLVTTLVERGWLTREVDAEDRRQVIVALTPTGRAVWDELRERGLRHMGAWLARLDDAERAALGVALAGLERVMG